MPIKKCSKCGLELPLSEFNKNKNAKDGLQDVCRKCFSEYNKRRYSSDPERFKANVKAYRKANPEKVLETRLKTCQKRPNMKNAHKAVDAALKCGALVRPDHCQGCGCSSDDRRIEAHHNNYSIPLDVIWLCPPCHKQMDMRRAQVSGIAWRKE